VAAGLEALGYHGIDPCLLAFQGELRARNHVRHLASRFVQAGRPGFRAACRSEYRGHAFLHDDAHDLFGVAVHQRDVHAERFFGRRAAFADMLAQQVGGHRAGADQPQSACFAHGCGQPPAAAPDHAARDDGVAYAEQRSDSVFHGFRYLSSCKNRQIIGSASCLPREITAVFLGRG